MNNIKTYTQEELNREEIISYIKDGVITPEIIAHLHGYHSAYYFYHLDGLDDETMECFSKHYERENNGLWTDDYILLVLDYEATEDNPYDYQFLGIVEWLELEFNDEDRKKELLDYILDKN